MFAVPKLIRASKVTHLKTAPKERSQIPFHRHFLTCPQAGHGNRGSVFPILVAGGLAALISTSSNPLHCANEEPELPSPSAIHTGVIDGDPARLEDMDHPAFKFILGMGPYGMEYERSSVHLLRSHTETEAKLRKAQTSTLIRRQGNPVTRIETNNLPAEGLGEDRLAYDIISKSHLPKLLDSRGKESIWDIWAKHKGKWRLVPGEAPGGKRDLVFISVFDGHGMSAAISDLARKTFHACLAWSLARTHALQEGSGVTGEVGMPAINEAVHQLFGAKEYHAPLDPKTEAVIEAIRNTYLAWDKDVLSAPLHFLNGNVSLPDNPVLPGFPNPSLAALADTAIRGAATVSAIIDVEADMFYVSNLGDCRAVAGWWDGKNGKWRCEVLSSDHRGENDKEAERLRAAHPEDERENVMLDQGNGIRVLGSSQPTRSIGGSTYKLPLKDSERMERVLGAKRQATDRPMRTPPYKTANPDIVARSLHPSSGEELKFIILGTDGFWDRMTSEEAALLVVAHMKHPRHPPIAKTALPHKFPHHPPSIPRPFPAEPVPGSRARMEGDWVFMDDVASTHLIRNSLGSRGWDEDTRRRVLSMSDGWVKFMRDDTTVMVTFFEDGKVV